MSYDSDERTMEGIDNVLEVTRWDDMDDIEPGQTSPVILMTPTSEMIEEISTYFEASQGALGNALEASHSTAAESESIGPPAITKVPVSRSRRYRLSRQSDTTASGDSGADSASSVYHPVRASATYNNLKGRRKWAFQAVRSPFIESNRFNRTLPSLSRGSFCSSIQEEAKLKTYAVGGFFKCIRLWHRVNQKRYVKASYLPAVYMDTDESLLPLSEGDETSDDDGIKIVVNNIFVKSRKKKCPGRQGGMPSSSQTKNQDHVKMKMSERVKGHGSLPVSNGSTSNQAKACYRPVAEPGSHPLSGGESHRAKEVRGSDPRPVNETASDGPSVPPQNSQPEEEVVQLEDVSDKSKSSKKRNPKTIGVISNGVETIVDTAFSHEATTPQEKHFSHPVDREVCLERDATETSVVSKRTLDNDNVEVVHKQRTKNREQKRIVTEVWRKDLHLTGPCTVVAAADVSQRVSVSAISTINHEVNEEHRNRKKRKKEKKRKVAEDGEINTTQYEPLPVEFSPVSQPVPGSAITIHNDNNDDDNEEHRNRKKRKKDKKLQVAEEGEIHTIQYGPLPVEFSPVSQPALGSAITIHNDNIDDNNEEHRNRKKRKKEKKLKVAEDGEINTTHDRPFPVEFSPVSQPWSAITIHNDNNDDDNEEHRKRKKRKNGNKRKLAAGEEITLDRPGPVVEPSNISQSTNNNTDDGLDVSREVLLKPKIASKKKKRQTHGVSTADEVNVVDTIFTNKTSTLTEATTVGFTKRKGKMKKRACPEDPETNQEVENAVGVNSVTHTTDREMELSRRKRREHKMSETSQFPSCEDILVEGSSLTSACDQKRKRHHSFLSNDIAENLLNAKKKFHTSFENRRQNLSTTDYQISTCEVEPEPVENGGTLVDSLTGPSEKVKKKKNKESDALRERGVGDDEVQECSALDARSSAEPGHEIVKRKRKKKDREVDTESESHLLVERDTPDDIEAALIKKKHKCKKKARPEHSGGPMLTDSVTISPRQCSPALDTEATQDGTTANPTADKKKMRKKRKTVVTACDPVPEET